MNKKTIDSVCNTLAALDASEYIIRLIGDNKPVISKCIDQQQLIKEISFLGGKNSEGYNIYFRPVGYQFVLLDDLHRSVLDELAKLKPCLLIETSPANYQAWLKLQETPATKEHAYAICRELAVTFQADLASAEPEHLGRLPGFTNRKPKRQKPDGSFPFVILHKWENRKSIFSPFGGLIGQIGQKIEVPLRNQSSEGRKRHREDFNLCCMLVNQGKSDDYIRQQLEAHSEKAKEVKPKYDYIGNTIKNARIKLGKF